ncbi:radical SAM/SPASM domain-containing protein [Halorussus salinus]|uniref:radical SAM/SPASM domain-containing protein n=1 Tax=Halorussus salinus TaxID=1364935 RepID=UPI001091CE7D|nr:radical SAM protein [Halorussus salinus]
MAEYEHDEPGAMSETEAVQTILSTDTRPPEGIQGKYNDATMMLNKLAFREEDQTEFPAIIGIDIIKACNLACDHCFLQSQSVPDAYPTFEQLELLRDQLDEARPVKVYLTGGEPTLHPSFYDVFELFADGPYDLTVFTNGVLVDDEMVAELAPYAGEVSFQVSFDGLGEVHRRIRGIEAEPVLDGIERLSDAGFDVHLRTTVQPGNVEQIPDIYEKSAELGVNYVEFAPILPTFGWDHLTDEPYPEFRERSLVAYAEFLRSRETFPVPIGRDPVPVPCGYDVSDEAALDGYICPAASTALEISAEGEVYPCPYLHHEEFSAGNVYEGDASLQEIWERSMENPAWACMVAYTNVGGDDCKECPHADACKGACPAAGFADTGKVSNPDYRCPRVTGD